jgi:hypothetical protein
VLSTAVILSVKILGEPAGPKRSRLPQSPRERLAALRFFEASPAGMQVRTPSGSYTPGIGHDLVP